MIHANPSRRKKTTMNQWSSASVMAETSATGRFRGQNAANVLAFAANRLNAGAGYRPFRFLH
jgi:hypothetical protein